MKVIIDFFVGIANTIGNIVDFFFSLIADFIDFLRMFANIPTALAGVISWLPSEFTFPLTVVFSIVILYKILGRD